MINKHPVGFYYIFLSIIIFGFSSCDRSDVDLVKNGKTKYVIVLPNKAHEYEEKAACELKKYLGDISNADFAIINEGQEPIQFGIWIGATSKVTGMTLTKEEILMKNDSGQLILSGGDPKSTLNCVYTFLENHLGCRFYSPEVEKVPKLQSISIDKYLNYKYQLPITTRTVHSRLFYENEDFADKRKVTHDAFPDYVPTARVHTFHHFVPKEKYYENHPEYYALRNGKRIPTQLCLTNKAVLQIVKDTVRVLLENNPTAKVISVSQDDNQQYCQCAACEEIHNKEESASGSMIYFVNEVAKEFPDIQISTLAYQYTRKAPKYIRPEDNVLITLCSIECDRSAPIEEKCDAFTQDLRAWGEKSDNVRIWDYTTQFTNFLAPFPNIMTLQPNIKLFRDNSARWIFEQHSNHPSELFELRSYLTANLLWNPEISVDSVMQDFLEGYYEEAGEYVGNYIRTVHQELQKDSTFFLFLYGDPSQAFDSFLNPDLLHQYDAWFDEAEKLVAEKPEVLDRVRAARLSIDYAILEASMRNIPSSFSLYITDDDGHKSIPEVLEHRLARFKAICEKLNITLMNEMGYKVDEYLEVYEKTINRAQQNNLAIGKSVKLLTSPKKYADENPRTLTDGALGGANFYANWLGFEGNDMEAIIDLETSTEISKISSAYLQVTNHIVFFPSSVFYYGSEDGTDFKLLGKVKNQSQLTAKSKVNDIQYFDLSFNPTSCRYIKVVADNLDVAPEWHHGAGMGSWIFADEIMVQ
ncbi:DUF4838 domain-containing protein [Reichenbachiella sp. MALMAid0571]|uniref:DUF4838 domain-containing protein n=1 Tax=Reichenbachiella sp. MALMAid0571 TaxID=3143939 RepID=UPI0032E0495F